MQASFNYYTYVMSIVKQVKYLFLRPWQFPLLTCRCAKITSQVFLIVVDGVCDNCMCVWVGEGWLSFYVKLTFYLFLKAIPREAIDLYFLCDFLSSETLRKTFPFPTLWFLGSQCHCWWFIMLVAKEGKRLLLFSLRPCFVKAPGICRFVFRIELYVYFVKFPKVI